MTIKPEMAAEVPNPPINDISVEQTTSGEKMMINYTNWCVRLSPIERIEIHANDRNLLLGPTRN